MPTDQAAARPCRASLAELRAQIDQIDDAILDLMERRLSLSSEVAAIKAIESDRRLKLRPRREAAVIGRLVRRGEHAPPELVERVWRLLMAYSLQGQGGMEIVIHRGAESAATVEDVRARFGPASLLLVDSVEEALAAARDHEAVAVIDASELPARIEDHGLVAFDRLAGGDALLVGRVDPDESLLPPEERR